MAHSQDSNLSCLDSAAVLLASSLVFENCKPGKASCNHSDTFAFLFSLACSSSSHWRTRSLNLVFLLESDKRFLSLAAPEWLVGSPREDNLYQFDSVPFVYFDFRALPPRIEFELPNALCVDGFSSEDSQSTFAAIQALLVCLEVDHLSTRSSSSHDPHLEAVIQVEPVRILRVFGLGSAD